MQAIENRPFMLDFCGKPFKCSGLLERMKLASVNGPPGPKTGNKEKGHAGGEAFFFFYPITPEYQV
jgi:hypothetical protein